MPSFLGMLITGVLPVIAIGAGLATLIALRQQRAHAARTWGIVALVAFAACVWVYLVAFGA